MSKWRGMVGFGATEEGVPGVYDEKVIERRYYGDVTRNVKKAEDGAGLNKDINISNDISIVSDAYAYQNFHLIKYVTFMGARWEVRSVEVGRPRLFLTIGGVYNGPTPETPGGSGENSGDEEGLLPAPGDSQDGLSMHSL